MAKGLLLIADAHKTQWNKFQLTPTNGISKCMGRSYSNLLYKTHRMWVRIRNSSVVSAIPCIALQAVPYTYCYYYIIHLWDWKFIHWEAGTFLMITIIRSTQWSCMLKLPLVSWASLRQLSPLVAIFLIQTIYGICNLAGHNEDKVVLTRLPKTHSHRDVGDCHAFSWSIVKHKDSLTSLLFGLVMPKRTDRWNGHYRYIEF
jgi:hypothetical protein